jgi:hypothetical protein
MLKRCSKSSRPVVGKAHLSTQHIEEECTPVFMAFNVDILPRGKA